MSDGVLDYLPLSIFQRSLARYGGRRLRVRVTTQRWPVADLANAFVSLAHEHSRFPARTVEVSRFNSERTMPCEPMVDASQERTTMVWGDLTVEFSQTSASEVQLDIEADPLIWDSESLLLALTDVAAQLNGEPPKQRPLYSDRQISHENMERDGDLQEEYEYWGSRSRKAEAQGFTHPRDIAPEQDTQNGAGQPRTVSLMFPQAVLAPLRATLGENFSVATVVEVALQIMWEATNSQPLAYGRITDARETLGLPQALGMISQVVPKLSKLDPDGDLQTHLTSLLRADSEDDEMVGACALAGKNEPKIVVASIDAMIPQDFRLVEWSLALGDTVVVQTSHSGQGLHVAITGDDYSVSLDALGQGIQTFLLALVHSVSSPVSEVQLALPNGSILPPHGLDASTMPAAVDIIDRFYKLAEQDPQAVAIIQGRQQITREALLKQVSGLREEMRDLGPGDSVGVVLEPSVDLVASYLAVLAQGAAFMPIATDEPDARISSALAQAGADAVITSTRSRELADGYTVEVIFADERSAVEVARAPEWPSPVSGQIGYLIRTSGTSGKAKAVAISRASLNNYLAWCENEFFADDILMPALSSPAFDASLKQLLGPIYCGSAVWILEADRRDVVAVGRELSGAEQKFSVNCVPSYWAEVLTEIGSDGLHKVLLGGEKLADHLIRTTKEKFPDCEIYNLYGPSETTATATMANVTQGKVSVGQPVAGAIALVMDSHKRILPLGIVGEIWLLGPGLGMGYLEAHDGERDAFREISLAEDTPVRAYATGDLGYVDGAGDLQVIGRKDDQLKVRGVRIEPMEVVNTAANFAGVRDSVVWYSGTGNAPGLRMAYRGSADSEELKKYLAQNLLLQAIPTVVTNVDEYPRAATGKIDFARIDDISSKKTAFDPSDYTEAERIVADAWRDLLGGEWPDPGDEFFACGGHSLLLARLVNRLRAQGNPGLSLRLVVRLPTVKSIAQHL